MTRHARRTQRLAAAYLSWLYYSACLFRREVVEWNAARNSLASKFSVVRQLRWPTGIQCPTCGASEIGKRGMHTHQAHRQRYTCQAGWSKKPARLSGELEADEVYLVTGHKGHPWKDGASTLAFVAGTEQREPSEL